MFKKYFLKFQYISTFMFLTFFNYLYANPTTNDKRLISEERIQKATTDLNKKTLMELVMAVLNIVTRYVVTILLGLIILMFLYGLVKYMFKGQSSDTARAEGRRLMLWGVIGIFVVTTWMALVAILTSLVGHDSLFVPQFNF